MQEDNIAIRLKVFIDETGLALSTFADNCGIPRPSLSQILSGRNKKISDIIIGQIHAAFPELSILWLLFGEGDMYVHNNVPPAAAEDSRSDGSLTLNSAAENSEKTANDTGDSKFSNLKGLTAPSAASQNAHNNGVNWENRCLELQRELDRFRKNPRKVVQITIYYDDSTFETFAPEK